MTHTENWIWLPESRYPQYQTTALTGFDYVESLPYTVAEFQKEYRFDKTITAAKLRVSGDTLFRLYLNGDFVLSGPPAAGGDFIGNEVPQPQFYAYETELAPNTNTLSFFARVQMGPVQICDFSMGHGGFMLSAILTFDDGTTGEIHTDESWDARRNAAYQAPRLYDGRQPNDTFGPAQSVSNRWHPFPADIPPRVEEAIYPEGSTITLAPGEKREVRLEFDQIHGAFIQMESRSLGTISLKVKVRELDEAPIIENCVLSGNDCYTGFFLHSVGNLTALMENRSESESSVTLGILSTHYPVDTLCDFVSSDPELDLVMQVCRHTLKICRQTHHLDSTRHCEPLACTGDYYIESLMTPFAFGDLRLAKLDLLRTARMLAARDGRMFHTTYSQIWVRMLWDVYMLTGDKTLLFNCREALDLLLSRFAGYMGENGLIETPPDYMFVDWIYVDKTSMHHPPKALGQTCLNLFHYDALGAAAKIYAELDSPDMAKHCLEKQKALGDAINTLLYDAQKGMYFEGLNTPTPEHLLGGWMPQNTKKRYYLKQSNILAAWVGVTDDETSRELVRKIMANEIPGDFQPYFAHFLFAAIHRLGLREEYTLPLAERWKAPVLDCTKGLAEGFVAPEPTYKFDHSHAWGGTPLYSVPKAILGLEINQPGMGELTLSPSLLGLSHARVEFMTPYGKVTCQLTEGQPPKVTHPEEVTIHLK
ncbi:MAG: hypothetical protein IKM13_13580 [Clostridia bacterium]|nr:hypothetical protein [Clostridia bacterium]